MALSLHSLQISPYPCSRIHYIVQRKETVVGSIAMESTKYHLVSGGLRDDLISNLGPVLTPPEEFVNSALFLRLGLPSTLIRYEKRNFSKTRRILKNAGFAFWCRRKTFCKRK